MGRGEGGNKGTVSSRSLLYGRRQASSSAEHDLSLARLAEERKALAAGEYARVLGVLRSESRFVSEDEDQFSAQEPRFAALRDELLEALMTARQAELKSYADPASEPDSEGWKLERKLLLPHHRERLRDLLRDPQPGENAGTDGELIRALSDFPLEPLESLEPLIESEHPCPPLLAGAIQDLMEPLRRRSADGERFVDADAAPLIALCNRHQSAFSSMGTPATPSARKLADHLSYYATRPTKDDPIWGLGPDGELLSEQRWVDAAVSDMRLGSETKAARELVDEARADFREVVVASVAADSITDLGDLRANALSYLPYRLNAGLVDVFAAAPNQTRRMLLSRSLGVDEFNKIRARAYASGQAEQVPWKRAEGKFNTSSEPVTFEPTPELLKLALIRSFKAYVNGASADPKAREAMLGIALEAEIEAWFERNGN